MKRYWASIVIVSCLGAAMHVTAQEAVSITVSPAVATATRNARVQVLIARNPMNRVLRWEIDGVNYYRSSTMQLDGASSPRSYVFVVRDIPAGEFEVRALVRRADNTIAVDRGNLRVIRGPR